MIDSVRPNAKAAYRVHIEGLSTTESKIFAGIIHLAERNGTVFQIEPVLERSDIFIFDGTNPQAVAFEKSHPELAQRTIWINPPTHLRSQRQISRPFRWPSVLAMMEQIVDGPRAADAPAQGQQPGSIGFERLCALAEDVLRKQIGIAAGFVIEDVSAEKARLAGATNAMTIEMFLDILKRHLPTNVDASAVFREVSAAARRDEPK